MTTSDPIADMLTRIRNANTAKHDEVDVPASNMKVSIAEILLREGYIKSFAINEVNGFKNIQEELQTTTYARLRFGISANYAKGTQIDYVLGHWSEDEVALLPERLEKISEAILSFGLAGADTTMNLYNNK